MKVALVHDDLVQWGGAERVLVGLTEIFPDAPIFTSVFDRDNKSLSRLFGSKKVRTSFLQNIPGWKFLYKSLLPLYPIAFEQFNFTNFDLVISQTTRFAKSIITKPKTKHICYCHTPPRFLWRLSDEGNLGILEPLISKLRIYDQVSARRVDLFLAGSENAKKRIEKIYKRQSTVVYPYIDLKRFEDIESFDGGYFLVIARLNKYKRIDLAVKACLTLNVPLKIIGSGLEKEALERLPRELKFARNDKSSGSIQFLGNINDEMVVQVLAGCRALIVPGIEDFGLTPVEAQALGKPVIAFKEGGVLETVINGKTGILFDKQDEVSLVNALENFSRKRFNSLDCKDNAQRFSKSKFVKDFKQIIASL